MKKWRLKNILKALTQGHTEHFNNIFRQLLIFGCYDLFAVSFLSATMS